MHIFGEEVDSMGELSNGEAGPDVVHQVSKDAVGQGPHCLPRSPAWPDQQVLIKQLVNTGYKPCKLTITNFWLSKIYMYIIIHMYMYFTTHVRHDGTFA